MELRLAPRGRVAQLRGSGEPGCRAALAHASRGAPGGGGAAHVAWAQLAPAEQGAERAPAPAPAPAQTRAARRACALGPVWFVVFLKLVGVVGAELTHEQAEAAYYDDSVDMREFWLDAPMDSPTYADAPPDEVSTLGGRAAPAGSGGGGPPRERSAPPAGPPPQDPTHPSPDPPDGDPTSWIRGWGLFGISWKDIGNRTYWFAEGMGGGTFRAVGSSMSAFSTREAGSWLSSDGGWVL